MQVSIEVSGSDSIWKAYGLKGGDILTRGSNRIKTSIPLSAICSFTARRKHKTDPPRPPLWKAASDQNDDRPITESEERQEISGWREKGWQAPAEI